ncbi:MAG: hypothetical protein HYV01_12595, partial [Deltaproteobacteria bacterium]|nr:hypothetical protein [Deltaproteobacteria bacterium]
MKAPGLVSFSTGLRAGLYLVRDELQALQLARLRRVVEHAYDHVAYYRRLFDAAGFKPRQLKRLADLQAIPVTTRERLQETPSEELISRTARPGRLHVSRTSGS